MKKNVRVKRREKALVDPSGYRIWYDFATDHYEKPYGEFAFIAPSGGWPMEWSVSTSFPSPTEVRNLNLKGGIHPQLKPYFNSNAHIYGATKIIAGKVTSEEAVFSTVEYPAIKEAVFSMDRPWVVRRG